MKRYGHKYMLLGLLAVVMTLLANGCASDGTSGYQETQVVHTVYGGYGTGYYHQDVIVTQPPASQPPAASPSPPPRASQLPSRSLPSSGPRPTPRRR